MPANNNQSAEGAGGLGIIRGNKVGESNLSRNSNVEFANLHYNNDQKKKKKHKKKKKKKKIIIIKKFM